jgi:putative tryptophan/tyrosine transport system substrate-binding protein
MRRRDAIALLAGAAALWPFSPGAQQRRLPTIGYLSSNPPDIPIGEVEAFKAGLAETGIVEGRDVVIDYRFAAGNYERLSAFAAELVAHRVDVIAASGAPATAIAKSATASIPIVFIVWVDPVASGLVGSLRGDPGGNLTGVTQVIGTLAAKQFQLLHELVPGAGTVGYLINPKHPYFALLSNNAGAAAGELGIEIVPLSAATEGEIEAAFALGREKGIGGLLLGADAFLRAHAQVLIRMADRYAIPMMYDEPEYVRAGGLISYGTRHSEMRRQAGVYVGRILKGAKPGDLPVQQPTKFELVLNLKTANALGLTIPQSLLARADEVIE